MQYLTTQFLQARYPSCCRTQGCIQDFKLEGREVRKLKLFVFKSMDFLFSVGKINIRPICYMHFGDVINVMAAMPATTHRHRSPHSSSKLMYTWNMHRGK